MSPLFCLTGLGQPTCKITLGCRGAYSGAIFFDQCYVYNVVFFLLISGYGCLVFVFSCYFKISCYGCVVSPFWAACVLSNAWHQQRYSNHKFLFLVYFIWLCCDLSGLGGFVFPPPEIGYCFLFPFSHWIFAASAFYVLSCLLWAWCAPLPCLFWYFAFFICFFVLVPLHFALLYFGVWWSSLPPLFTQITHLVV